MADSLKLILNGEVPNAKESALFIDAIANPRILRRSGGYLFKAGIHWNEFHLGIVPAISEGERLHHYDIDIPDKDPIIGSISANGEFTLLFRADQAELNENIRRLWRDKFLAFADILFDRGYRESGTLDWITRQIIEESDIFSPVPETLKAIREYGER